MKDSLNMHPVLPSADGCVADSIHTEDRGRMHFLFPARPSHKGPGCPLIMWSSRPLVASHILTVPSRVGEASHFPSGLNATLRVPESQGQRSTSFPVITSHTWMALP